VEASAAAPDQRRPQLVVEPFRESWGPPAGAGAAAPARGSECLDPLARAETTIESGGRKVRRTVVQRDGVVDMTLEGLEDAGAASAPAGGLVLRIEVGVRNRDGAYFPNPHAVVPTSRGPPPSLVSSAAIQDDTAKASVLASWPTDITSPSEGVIEVVVMKKGERMRPDESRRIRIITEDVSEVHDKRTEWFPSTYARQMTVDFVDELEMYYTDS
jgi:hypothetical protein